MVISIIHLILPILIFSTISWLTKLRSPQAMPHLMAPDCPEGPPPATIASTSTELVMFVKIKGNNSWNETKLWSMDSEICWHASKIIFKKKKQYMDHNIC